MEAGSVVFSLLVASAFFSLSLAGSNGCGEHCNISYIDDYYKIKENYTCLLMSATITFRVQYNATDGNGSRSPHFREVCIPVDCSTLSINYNKSSCNMPWTDNSYNVTHMVVRWGDMDQFEMSVSALANHKGNGQWNISNITIGINVTDAEQYFINASLPDAGMIEGHSSGADGNELFGSINHGYYYLCNKNRTFPLTMNTAANKMAAQFKINMDIENLRIKAFDTDGDDFGTKKNHCYQDFSGPPFIPIVVGSVIGGLVFVVLVAYIVGRFRNKKKEQSGYEKL